MEASGIKPQVKTMAFYLCLVISIWCFSWWFSSLFLPCPYSKAASQYDQVHIAGVGDYSLAGITALPDPCPLPSAAKKKGLRDKEKLFYAPMSGLGDLLYDKDAVYININDHFVQFSKVDETAAVGARRGTIYPLCIWESYFVFQIDELQIFLA